MKELRKPQIRFAGFTDDWEQRKLGDIATFSKGQGYSKSDLISSGFPIILYGQLYTNYQTSISDVTTFVNNNENAIKSIGNEVIVPASGETAEDIARATAIEKQGIIIGGDLNIVRPNKKVRPFFLALTLSNGNPKNSIAKKAQGKSVVHIRNDDLKEIQIIFPNTEEQTAIGNFFKQLDETIALHQREYEKYKNLKISYLEKMFPKENEQFPELRFPEFTDAWEQRKLGEIADIRRGASPRPIQNPIWFDKDSDIGWLRIADVTEQNGKIYRLEQKLSEQGQKHTLVLTEPHLILSIAATVGKPVINYIPTGIHDGFIGFLNLDADIEFLYQWLGHFQENWKNLGQSGSQVNINSDLVRNLEIALPSKQEQTAIGDFFKQLDETIALHQRELEKYKQIKQSYLEKMFV